MLFPELTVTASDNSTQGSLSFEKRLGQLEQAVLQWARGLEGLGSLEERAGEVQLGNVIVHYASDAVSSFDLQERKRALLKEGLELYFIYPWEYAALPKIFSHFNSRLGLDERKFAAKRLKLEKIPQKEADSFMEANHIQGSARGSQKVSYGLRLEATGELLAVQQYCKSRWMLKKLEENPGIWEGLRLASKRNVQIHGAATRLQKAFLKEYRPTELMSYVDFSHSLGSYKEIQGFSATVTAQEAYMWALTEKPQKVEIIDKDGVPRVPDLEIVKRTPYLNPSKMAGAFGKGVGQTFYGGKLGSRKQLLERGNQYFHNDLIMEAIGYRRIRTAGQLKWSKKFPESKDA